MAQIFLTTVGPNDVFVADLGNVTFVHPQISLPLIEPDGEFESTDVQASQNLIDEVNAGTITLVDCNGNAVTDMDELVGGSQNSLISGLDIEINPPDTINVDYPLSPPDGTQAAPIYSFASAPGSGWYREASGDIALAVNGLCTLEVNPTGQVYISTDVPNYETLVTGNNVFTNKKYVDDTAVTFVGYNTDDSTQTTTSLTPINAYTENIPVVNGKNYHLLVTWEHETNFYRNIVISFKLDGTEFAQISDISDIFGTAPKFSSNATQYSFTAATTGNLSLTLDYNATVAANAVSIRRIRHFVTELD